MVAGNIEQKIKSMTDEDLDAKVIQMLREAAATLVELRDDNDGLMEVLREALLILENIAYPYPQTIEVMEKLNSLLTTEKVKRK